MGSTTPIYALPYPVGTDRVADGDNAIQALAERVEARLPGGFMAEAIGTVSQSGITTIDITGLSVTVTVPAGRRIRVTALVNMGGSQSAWAEMKIMQDGVLVASATSDINVGAYAGFRPEWSGKPSAGSHNYKVQAVCAAGTGVTYTDAQHPMFIRVEDIGT